MSRQSDIALEKFWVTQCGWIRLFTTVAMGMKITNCWKLFCYGVKRDHYDKIIGVRELSEQIAVYCFGNTVITYKVTLSNIIPYLGDIDNEGTVYTCKIINYSSSSPRNSYISTISYIMIDTALTTAICYKAPKEVELEGGRYNMAARSYYHRRSPNGKICVKRSLWY